MQRGMTVKDRIGQRIGRLVVIGRAANRLEKGGPRACWVCRCDCGNSIVVIGHSLSRGLRGKGGTRSCGCLAKEKPIKHGMHDTRVYRIWHMMIQRCCNPKNSHYRTYGGRGITVCDEWKDFRGFFADMGNPKPTMTIERIDNSLGYFKANCRWATRKEQGNNRSTNFFITYHGKKQTIAQLADGVGMHRSVLHGRIKAGWPIHKALTTPVKKKQKRRTSVHATESLH